MDTDKFIEAEQLKETVRLLQVEIEFLKKEIEVLKQKLIILSPDEDHE